ncbi:MAG: EamA family transporter [Arenimonas sp.]
MPTQLRLSHFLLALAVVAVWGTNFVVIKLALGQFPPLLFAALRFSVAFIPAAFFLPRPAASWRNLSLYGLLIGVGQFGVLYLAMRGRISPGLASLVIQTQVFFTIGIAMWLIKERMHGFQWLALLLAASGIVLIAVHTDGTTTVAGLLMVLLAAMSWAGGNIASMRAGNVNMLAYVVWSSAISAPTLLLLSLFFEGWDAIRLSVSQANLAAWLAVAWQGWGNTLFGFAAWAWLLGRYPAATISPVAFLVPVFGMAASALLLDEALPAWKLTACALVMSGLGLNLFWPLVRAKSVNGGRLSES